MTNLTNYQRLVLVLIGVVQILVVVDIHDRQAAGAVSQAPDGAMPFYVTVRIDKCQDGVLRAVAVHPDGTVANRCSPLTPQNAVTDISHQWLDGDGSTTLAHTWNDKIILSSRWQRQ